MSLQTRGTCWFYSILNGFILSSSGQKLIFLKMNEFFDSLNDTQKKIFLDPTIDACPRDYSKVNPFKFYKFFNQYLCFKGGPRGIKNRAGLSPNLLNNIELVGNTARTYKGAEGANQKMEVMRILSAIGITEKEVKVIIDPYYLQPVNETPPGYTWVYSSASIYNDDDGKYSGHAITLFKYGIFDSNYMKIIPASNYPQKEEILEYASKKYPKYNKTRVDFHVYVKNSLIENVHPSCERVYRNIKVSLANARNYPSTPARVSYYKRELAKRISKIKAKSKPTNQLGVYESKKGHKFKISTLGTRSYIYNNSRYQKTNNISRKNRPIYKSKSGSRFTITPSGKKIYYPSLPEVIRRTKFLDYKKRPIFEITKRNSKKLFVKNLGRRKYGVKPRFHVSKRHLEEI
jgi:hypothetical protein